MERSHCGRNAAHTTLGWGSSEVCKLFAVTGVSAVAHPGPVSGSHVPSAARGNDTIASEARVRRMECMARTGGVTEHTYTFDWWRVVSAPATGAVPGLCQVA